MDQDPYHPEKELIGVRAKIDGEIVMLHPDDVEFVYRDAAWVTEAHDNLARIKAVMKFAGL